MIDEAKKILGTPALESLGYMAGLQTVHPDMDRALTLTDARSGRKLLRYLDAVQAGTKYSPQAKRVAGELKREYLAGEFHWKVALDTAFIASRSWVDGVARKALEG